MKLDKRHRNVLNSIFLFLGLSGVTFIIPWDSDFAGAGILFATQIVAIFTAGIFVVMRLSKASISKTNFLYNYVGVLNLILSGLFCIGMIVGKTQISAVLFLFVHLSLGAFIVIDIFKKANAAA